MEAMFLLIAISVVFVVAIGVAFWWAIFAGQFDNSDSAGRSILHDTEADPGLEPGKAHTEVNTLGSVDTGAGQNNATSVQTDEASQAEKPK